MKLIVLLAIFCGGALSSTPQQNEVELNDSTYGDNKNDNVPTENIFPLFKTTWAVFAEQTNSHFVFEKLEIGEEAKHALEEIQNMLHFLGIDEYFKIYEENVLKKLKNSTIDGTIPAAIYNNAEESCKEILERTKMLAKKMADIRTIDVSQIEAAGTTLIAESWTIIRDLLGNMIKSVKFNMLEIFYPIDENEKKVDILLDLLDAKELKIAKTSPELIITIKELANKIHTIGRQITEIRTADSMCTNNASLKFELDIIGRAAQTAYGTHLNYLMEIFTSLATIMHYQPALATFADRVNDDCKIFETQYPDLSDIVKQLVDSNKTDDGLKGDTQENYAESNIKRFNELVKTKEFKGIVDSLDDTALEEFVSQIDVPDEAYGSIGSDIMDETQSDTDSRNSYTSGYSTEPIGLNW